MISIIFFLCNILYNIMLDQIDPRFLAVGAFVILVIWVILLFMDGGVPENKEWSWFVLMGLVYMNIKCLNRVYY